MASRCNETQQWRLKVILTQPSLLQLSSGKGTSHSCRNYSQVDPCSAGGGLEWILWYAAQISSLGMRQLFSHWLGLWWLMTLSLIPLQEFLLGRVLSQLSSGPFPKGSLHPMTGNENRKTLLPQGRTTLRVISDPQLPEGLAEVFAVVQWQFNSSICRILLFPHRR